MPSTFSQNGLELMAAGEKLNVWGDPTLNNTLKRANYLVSGYQSIAITGDYTLTSSNSSTSQADFNAYNALLKFTGSLSANSTITVPSVAMRWMIYNATNKTLTVTTGSGDTVAVETGDTIPVYCDGTNVRTINYGGLTLKAFIAASVLAATGSLPAVTGNAGKYVYTDGATSYWKQVEVADIANFSATAAQVRTGTTTGAALTPGDTYGALAEVTLTDGATITPDLSTGINFTVTLAGNRALANPTNPKVGQVGWIRIVQDATGSRTLSFGANWKRVGGAPTLTTTASATDILVYQVITSSFILYDLLKSPS